jgi:hypothetical protein
MFWKPLLEHNPTKLDSAQNFTPIENDKSAKINYTQGHINYYYKSVNPKIEKPVGQAREHNKLPLEIGITQK